jgi:hypothetical protein
MCGMSYAADASSMLDASRCLACPGSGYRLRLKWLIERLLRSRIEQRYAGRRLVERFVRAPGRLGAWSSEEVAHGLYQRRAQLRHALDRRWDARGIPPGTRDEIIDEAIGVVAMSRKPIRNEPHLQGAFWTTIRLLLAQHRAGRHQVRVGSRSRVDFDHATATLPDGHEPFDLVASRERIARAADFMAQLDPFEQRVVVLMAARGLGVKLAARVLGAPISVVLATARSADRKLQRVATIASAGRMCAYREPALLAHAHGTAHPQQELAAKAHLAACAACRQSHAQLLRERQRHPANS